jgi:hypothetical protein
MLYRGFSNVHARLLLGLQANIQKLESELDKMDRIHDTLPDAAKKRLQSWDLDVAACREEKEDADEEEGEEVRTRSDNLEELRIKVNQYDELLIKARELVSFQKPTERDYTSVRHWFHNNAPLVDDEQEYIFWKEDIVTLRHGREWAGFDGMVEAMLHKMNGPLIQVSKPHITDCTLLTFYSGSSERKTKGASPKIREITTSLLPEYRRWSTCSSLLHFSYSL